MLWRSCQLHMDRGCHAPVVNASALALGMYSPRASRHHQAESWVCNPICMMDRSNASAHYGAPPSPQVCNPIYMMRASRTATCELFLRQESRERLPEGGGFTEGQVSALMTFGVDALMTFDDL